MSKDSSSTYLHMHHPHLADHFEDFTRPHTSLSSSTAAAAAAAAVAAAAAGIPANATLAAAAGVVNGGTTATAPNGAPITYGATSDPSNTVPSFLPVEEVYLPPHYQPVNPEDEDDVVPDQHAAFGITRAMDAAGSRRQEPLWRDLGLQELVRGERLAEAGAQRMALRGIARGGGVMAGTGVVGAAPARAGVFLASTDASASLRVKDSGSMMGGRRVRCLR